MIKIYNRTLTLSDALEQYDRLSVYSVYYINPVLQRQLMLNFGAKENEEIVVRDSLKYIEIVDDVNINVTTYAIIPGVKRATPTDHIKVLRPLYNLILMRDNVYKEDMPHHYFVNYTLVMYKGLKVLYDPQGYVMVISQSIDNKGIIDEILNL